MKISDILNLKNISSYIEGHAKIFYNNLVGLPDYQKEQIAYRLDKCKSDCIPNRKCIYCGCPPHKKAFVKKSCNNGERFPDIMDEYEWEEFKRKNEIK